MWGPGHPAGGTDIPSSWWASCWLAVNGASWRLHRPLVQLTFAGDGKALLSFPSFPFSSLPASGLGTVSALDAPSPYLIEQCSRQETLQEDSPGRDAEG